jgi:hypothetical protein
VGRAYGLQALVFAGYAMAIGAQVGMECIHIRFGYAAGCREHDRPGWRNGGGAIVQLAAKVRAATPLRSPSRRAFPRSGQYLSGACIGVHPADAATVGAGSID